MKKGAFVLAILAAFTVPVWAQRGRSAAHSNPGGEVRGLNRAEEIQNSNPTGKAQKGLSTAEKNAAVKAGGDAQGAAHAKKGKHKGKK
jgi:hypothetical protein